MQSATSGAGRAGSMIDPRAITQVLVGVIAVPLILLAFVWLADLRRVQDVAPDLSYQPQMTAPMGGAAKTTEQDR